MRKLMETVSLLDESVHGEFVGEIEGHLSDMLDKFQDYYGLEHASADESSYHTERQRQWLHDFILLWDSTQELQEEEREQEEYLLSLEK